MQLFCKDMAEWTVRIELMPREWKLSLFYAWHDGPLHCLWLGPVAFTADWFHSHEDENPRANRLMYPVAWVYDKFAILHVKLLRKLGICQI